MYNNAAVCNCWEVLALRLGKQKTASTEERIALGSNWDLTAYFLPPTFPVTGRSAVQSDVFGWKSRKNELRSGELRRSAELLASLLLTMQSTNFIPRPTP